MHDDFEVQYMIKNPYEDIQTTVVSLVQPMEEGEVKKISKLLLMQIEMQCVRIELETLELKEKLAERKSREKRKRIKTIK